MNNMSKCGWLRCVLALAWLLVAGAATAQEVPPQRWVLVPYLNLGASYDDNVYRASSGTTNDVFLESEVGVSYRSSTATNQWHLLGDAFYLSRFYGEESDLDFNAFGEELKLRVGGEGATRVEVMEGFRRMEDVDHRTPESAFIGLSSYNLQDINSLSARRDLLDAGLAGEQRMSDRTDVALAYRYSFADYDDQDLLDLDGHLVQAESSYVASDKSAVYADLRYGSQDQEGGGASADLINGHVGVRTRAADKLVGRAGVGWEYYAWTQNGRDETEDTVSFDLSADWQAMDKVSLYGGVNNGNQLSSFYSDNALTFINTWAGVAYQWLPQMKLWLRGTYRRDRYLDPVIEQEVSQDRRDERVEVSVRADYLAPSQRWGFYAEASREHVLSTIDSVEYDNTRLTLGTRLMY